MSRILLALVMALAACKGGDEDGDKFSSDVDCDDADPAVYPGAPELCDGVDNDCDGTADDQPTDGLTLYADADGDGYGTPNYTLAACGAQEGWVENGDDCDDLSALALPGGSEICDGHDNDCNSTVDDGVADAPVWYADEDGDGYGATGSIPVQNCAGPSGYVDNDGDCDDTNADLSPETRWYVDADSDGYGALEYPIITCEQPEGAVSNYEDCDDLSPEAFPGNPEVCDRVDNDCNGLTDADDPAVTDLLLWYPDGDGDGYGSGQGEYECFAPSGYSSMGEDCDDADLSTYPGAEELCDSIDNDCDVRIDNGCPLLARDAPILMGGTSSSDYLGYTLSISADINGDGANDLVAGAYGDDGADGLSGEQGAVYVFYGPFTTGAYDIADADALLRGLNASDYFGYDIGQGADITGDGVADLLTTAYGDDTAGNLAGAAYVFAGPVSGELDASSAAFTVYGENSSDYLGQYYHEPAGDLNGDGALDLAVGAYAWDYASGSSSAGSIYVFYGPNSGAASAGDADLILHGTAASDYVGYPALLGEDFNADGAADMLIGASGSSSGSGTNGALIVYGPFASETLDVSAADVSFLGDSSSRGTGSYVAAGDLDGDGTLDVVIGAKYASEGGSYSGAVYTVNGPFTASYSLPTDAVFTTYEADSSTYLGGQYNGLEVADVDQDGAADIIAGSYSHSSITTGGGGAFLFYGPMSGSMPVGDADRAFLGTSTAEYVGYGIDVADVDGDGLPEVAVSGRGYSGGAGRVSIWLGTGL